MSTPLEIKNLSISRESKIICKDISWQISAGQCWGVLGKNGQGKTTLLHTLAGLYRPLSGKVYCLGEEIKNLRKRILAKRLSLLLQEHHYLFPIRVLEVIKSGAHAQDNNKNPTRLLAELIAQLELEHLALRNIQHLSGGEQQRVAIARIIYQNPNVFLLDEPTQQLDPYFQHQVMRYFQQLCHKENKIVMFASHDVTLIDQYCSDVMLLLPEGELMFGSKEQLLNKENLTKVYGKAASSLQLHCEERT